MARILYGVAGEGFGHSTRSELLGRRLINAGHDVLFAASQKSLRYLLPTFEPQVRNVHGLFFYYHGGRIKPIQTLFRNIAKFPRGHRVNRRLFKEDVKAFKPDLVISDFEPFSAWWACRNKVPCVSIDNEHFLTCCKLEKERAYWKERWMANIVTRGYHAFADAYLIPSFFNVPVHNKSARLTPPVVRDTVMRIKPSDGDHVIVYSTDAGKIQRERIFNVVRQFGTYRFYIYGFDEDVQVENCTFKKNSTKGFLTDLASCRGVVATAGFSLLSECLYFRKSMLLMPVQDQYEQLINSYYVEKLGCGERTDALTAACFEKYISKLNVYNFDHPDLVCTDNKTYFSIVDKTFTDLGFDLGLTAVQGESSDHQQELIVSEADDPFDHDSRSKTG